MAIPAPADARHDGHDVLFYDGTCALCHGAVAFVAARDRDARFLFAPLTGTTAAARLPPDVRGALPDSFVVHTGTGATLVRSDAVLYVMRRVGGWWSAGAALGRVVPRVLRDGVYDAVARVRYRLFGRARDVCPIVPADLRARFLG